MSLEKRLKRLESRLDELERNMVTQDKLTQLEEEHQKDIRALLVVISTKVNDQGKLYDRKLVALGEHLLTKARTREYARSVSPPRA